MPLIKKCKQTADFNPKCKLDMAHVPIQIYFHLKKLFMTVQEDGTLSTTTSGHNNSSKCIFAKLRPFWPIRLHFGEFLFIIV